ncbi:MAG: hypothetical protein ACREHG_11385, partial [Candidatus Saccharimonadales bacterium]
TCTATAGTDTPNLSSAAASGWTATAIDSNHDIKLTTTSVSFTGGTAITPIDITGVTNPSNSCTLGSFYARILVYNNGGSSTYSSPTSIGSDQEYGGIALSTTSNISITSKVYETLSFCVFSGTCGTAPSLLLGDPTTHALSATTAYVNSDAKYTLATNASSGIVVTMTGTTLCRSTGSNCDTGTSTYTISAIGATAGSSITGNEQFGMCADTTGATGTLAASSPYADSTSGNSCHTGIATGSYTGSSDFAFNDGTGSNGTNSGGGSKVLSATGPVSSYTGDFAFLGNISSTTEAGIYTTSLNMVATGTF